MTMPRKYTRQFNVRATDETIDKLNALCKRSGMSQGGVIKRLIIEAFQNETPVQFLRATGAGDD